MAARKTVTDRGIEFEVVWSGQKDEPWLLRDACRPSSLADLIADARRRSSRRYVRSGTNKPAQCPMSRKVW